MLLDKLSTENSNKIICPAQVGLAKRNPTTYTDIQIQIFVLLGSVDIFITCCFCLSVML